MACIPLETDESRIRDIEQRLKAFRAFAVAHMNLEAKFLTDGGSWVDEMIEQFRDEVDEVGSLRNKAMRI